MSCPVPICERCCASMRCIRNAVTVSATGSPAWHYAADVYACTTCSASVVMRVATGYEATGAATYEVIR